MSWVYEIALRAAPDTQMALNGWFASGPRSAMAELPGLTCADCYTPAEGSALDPYNHDTSGPLMLLMLDFGSLQNLAEAMKKRLIASRSTRCQISSEQPAQHSSGGFIRSVLKRCRRRLMRHFPMSCVITVLPRTKPPSSPTTSQRTL